MHRTFHSLPKDSLDLVLTSTYNQSTEKFADKEDLYIQPETIGCETWRRLRNAYHKCPVPRIPMGKVMEGNEEPPDRAAVAP
ncbi:hypothetical protein MSG28_003940 [Choristoneura fumiferana]|uniref:Uncharacterized protein n=1 Tax=Choristoneura fumiferana TaxID=7141 RepID=A0ACC0KHK1_CHOFU|nr:hypothetical protein MSG28_003940 [Choristoneura fumiferana]